MADAADLYLAKAVRSLAGAESEFANGRHDNCANRSYYACFQAAVAALLRAGVQPAATDREWGHAFVQARFAGDLIGRRKLYPADLRDALSRTLYLRHLADYRAEHVSEIQAARAVRAARSFVQAISSAEGNGYMERVMSVEDQSVQSALAELRELIGRRYPSATFRVTSGEDPEGTYLVPTVDVEDPEEVFDLVVDRLLDIQIERGLPVYVFPVRPAERVLREVDDSLAARRSGGRTILG